MQFTIKSDEGLPIRGDFEAADDPRALVVIVHGFKGFKDWGFFPWTAQRLMQHRLAVCRFNMSRSGIGEDPETFDRLDLFEHDTYSTQLRDLAALVRHAQREFPNLPTFLLGHSRGGGVALLGAEDVPNLQGVVVWAPIARVDRWDKATRREWRKRGVLEVENARTKQIMRMSPVILDDYEANAKRLDVLAAVSRLRVPLLVLHGGRDESVPVDEGRLIAARASESSLVVLHRASHTFNAIHPLVHVPFELLTAAELSAHFVNAYV
ncbi:MAG TPA: alpha/beta fold hydrolase [Thermoanaerobaculia bacterium]|jgi:pimeloyl-ACP methyl ester carboxylesterase|nr:alpha/beta fold hydrolase [Thermoanaerobaculia bacterium]